MPEFTDDFDAPVLGHIDAVSKEKGTWGWGSDGICFGTTACGFCCFWGVYR